MSTPDVPGMPGAAGPVGAPGAGDGPDAPGILGSGDRPDPPVAADDSAHDALDGIAELDLDRMRRRGIPEAVLCDAKSPDQVAAIAREYARLSRDGRDDLGTVLFTRADAARAAAVLEALPSALHDPQARLLAWPAQPPEPSGGLVVVVCAGTSDLPIAREAELTARYLGRPTRLIADIGIAGLHRMNRRLPELREAACVVVAAGMDGALPTVIAGQIAAPVVALPTSVGYGVAAGGYAAALTMLAGCAPGIGVVNIDNGYGAGHLAAQIARWAPAPTDEGHRPGREETP